MSKKAKVAKKRSTATIISSLDKMIRVVRTRTIDISFNELLDMYVNKELIITPEYQRLFRWSPEQQSQFIESILLEMPLPPIFAIELKTGKYELIDGLQRFSSYANFRGKLESVSGSRDKAKMKHLELLGCDIIPELNGMQYDQLPEILRIRLKRHFIRMEIIREESEEKTKYHLFKRLNTGGIILLVR